MIFDVTCTEDRRERILRLLKLEKFEKVVDIGGVTGPWAREFVTHYIDLTHPVDYLPKHGPDMYDDHVKNAKVILGDIEDIDFLRKVRERYGVFDFVICTQVLEHLGNPQAFLKYLPHLGVQGFMGVPNKYVELSRNVHCGEDGKEMYGMKKIIRGFAPHRWIFTLRESPYVLFGWPKLTILEQMMGMEWVEEGYELYGDYELSFRWSGRIPYKFVDDRELGAPSIGPVIDLYRRELQIGI